MNWIIQPLILVMQLVILFALWRSGRNIRSTYKSVREELDLIEKEVARQGDSLVEINSLKYRMDVFEGKHIRARNLGMGLPQPRDKDGK